MLVVAPHGTAGGSMSEYNDKRSRKDRKPRVNDELQPDDLQGDAATADALQGEGDYQASRRYREQVADFIATADVDALARKAAPDSAQQARDLALAEASGRDRSKGDDAADPGLMYPNRESGAER
jgi:hypothetical protein